MEKALTFKRKVYEVEAIQFKGEQNAKTVIKFLSDRDVEAAGLRTFSQGEGFPEVTVLDYKNKGQDWNMASIDDWFVYDYSGQFGVLVMPTKAFARRYEGI